MSTRRTFIKTTGIGAAGLLLSGCNGDEPPRPAAQGQGTPAVSATGTVTLKMTVWGSCLYEFRRTGDAYALRVGFLKTAPAGCTAVTHVPELFLVSGKAKKVGGNATINAQNKWIIPQGTLTIDPASVNTAPGLNAVGVNDGPQPCPADPAEPSQVRSLGFIPQLKTKGNFTLKSNWPDDALLVATLDRGTITANPLLNDASAMPVWYHRTDDTNEDQEHAFSDTTRYEVVLSGGTVLFRCANETLELAPDGSPGTIELQLNAMPTDSMAEPPLKRGDALPHFCALYAPFHPNGNPAGQAPDSRQRYVPRYQRYCSDRLNVAGVQGPSPGKYCSGGRVMA